MVVVLRIIRHVYLTEKIFSYGRFCDPRTLFTGLETDFSQKRPRAAYDAARQPHAHTAAEVGLKGLFPSCPWVGKKQCCHPAARVLQD